MAFKVLTVDEALASGPLTADEEHRRVTARAQTYADLATFLAAGGRPMTDPEFDRFWSELQTDEDDPYESASAK
jgi:hypothetical protein